MLTVDQRRSRRGRDRVPEALSVLAGLHPERPFERTAGDEFQGVLSEPADVVEAVLRLARSGGWSMGVGAGPVEEPLPESTRAGRGEAFVLARDAVEAAKGRPQGLVVRAGGSGGPGTEAAADAEALLVLLVLVVERRSAAAWEAIDLVAAGLTTAEAAVKLGISRQAVGQRLAAAHWQQECRARPAAVRLLARAAA